MKRNVTIALLTLLSILVLTAAAQAQVLTYGGLSNGRSLFYATEPTVSDGQVYTVSATLNGSTPWDVYEFNNSALPVTEISASGGDEGIVLNLFILPPPSGTVVVTATLVGDPSVVLTGMKTYVGQKTATITSLSITPTSQTYGAVVLTATVSATTGTPNGGNVTFRDNGVSLPVTAPVVSGVAILHAEGLFVGTHTITAAYSGDNSFASSASAPIGLTIAPADLIVNGITAENKVYDAGTSATLNKVGASLQGVVIGDDVTANFSGATGTFSDKNVGTKTVTVAGITISGGSIGNYTLVQPTTTADISPKVLTVKDITAIDKTYDGKTSADLNTTSAALVGVVGEEVVNLHVELAIGSFADDKNVGTSKPVIVSGIFINGPDGGNYTVTQPTSLTASISKATASVTPLAAAKTYGAPEPVLSGYLSGFAGSDNVTGTYSRTAGETVAGGPYTISATLSPTAALSNYAITYNTATFTIHKATASVSPAAASKTYGASDPTLTGTLAGFVSGDGVTAAYSRVAGESVAGSPYTISATLSPEGVLDNYTITYNTAGFTINKASASVTPNAAGKVYGATDPALTGTITGFVPSDGVTATYTRAAGEAVAGSPYAITATLTPEAALANYTITYNAAAFTVTKATVSPSFTANNKVYDGTTSATIATRALSGGIGSDDVSLAGGVAIFADANVGGGKTVDASGFSLSGSTAGNYQVSSTSATTTANITKAAASVTPAAATKTYGAADPALTGSLTGFVSGDGVSASYSRTAGETAGQYTISAALAPANVLENYDVTYNTALFTVTKASASVTPNAATKVYGALDPTLTGTLTGFLSADGVTATYSRTAGETVVGSPYLISATLSPAGVLGNYNVAYNTAHFTITTNTSATVLTSSAATSVYGQSVTFTATVTDLASTPTGTVTFKDAATILGTGTLNGSGVATLSTSALTVGTHSITAEYGGDANFAGSISSLLSHVVSAPHYTLTVTGAHGSVAKTPDQPDYVSGTTVALAPTAEAGYHFVNWSGDVTGTANPVSVTMDGNKNITADFAINTYTLTATATNGTIAKNPDQPSYNHGTAVQLTATPAAGYHFVNWSGDVTGTTNPVSVVLDGNKSVTANFAINSYTLTLTASNGTVTKNPDQPTYSSGATVQLSAIPAPTYHFVNWGGDASGTSNPVTVTMDANKTITANFVGNTAPTVGTITAPLDPVTVNTSVSASVTFTDPDPNDPHTATWNWGDGASSAGVLGDQDVVTGSHTYAAAGVYTVGMTVTDACGAQATTEFEFVVVYNPNGGFVVGGAWITSPTGAYVKNPTYVAKGYFAFVATYLGNNPVPVGITSFQLRPSLFKPSVLDFKSTHYQWLVVSGALAQYKGVGTINGSGSYGFLLVVTDGNVTGGDKKDRFRIKIWDKNNSDAVVYDNQPDADDDTAPTTVIDGGLIAVFSFGSGNRYLTDAAPSIERVIDEEAETLIPTEYTLYNAYPNPFNPSTTIRFDLPEATKVRLAVYDMLGREVAVLADGERPAGQYSVRFDAGKLSSGTYIYRLQTGTYVQTRKLMLMK